MVRERRYILSRLKISQEMNDFNLELI
jgi:hypothetical protein